jgi:hypothetical protein
MQSGANQQRSRPVIQTRRLQFQQSGDTNIMQVFLENRKLDAAKTITAPYQMGFAELVAFVRSVEPDRRWEIIETI